MAGKITGVDVLVYIDVSTTGTPDYKPVGGQSNATLNREADSIDVTSKENVGGYREFLPGFKSWSIEMEGFIVLNDDAFDLLESKFEDRAPVLVEVKYQNGKTYKGTGSITEFTNEFPVDDGASYTCTIEGASALEITPATP